MKKLTIIIITIIFPMMIHAQSDSLNIAFKKVCTTLKEYKIASEDVKDDSYAKTLSITLKIQEGCFVFTINDDFGNFSDPAFGHRHGVTTLKVPYDDVVFDVWYNLRLQSKNGIELTYKGKKEILESYKFYGEKLSLKKLCEELQRLQKIAIEENFHGNLPVQKKITPTANPEPQKNKKNTPPQPRKRNRVPAGI